MADAGSKGFQANMLRFRAHEQNDENGVAMTRAKARKTFPPKLLAIAWNVRRCWHWLVKAPWTNIYRDVVIVPY
jgi:hypothetical protein